MLRYFYLLIILFLNACTLKQTESTPIKVDLSHPGYISSKKYLQPKSIIFPESHPDALIASIEKIIFHKDRIYIFEPGQHAIMAFDTTGKYIFSTFPTGRGPGEYEQAQDFVIDRQNDEILLYCDRPYKFMYFDLNGKFKRDMTYDNDLLFEIALTDNGKIIGLNSPEDQPDNIITLITPGKTKTLKNIQFPMPHYSIHGFVTKGKRLINSEQINFAKLYENSIYSVMNNRIMKRYSFDFGENNLPAPLNTPEIDPKEFMRQNSSHRYVFSIVDIKETKSTLFFRTNLPGFFFLDKEKNSVDYIRGIKDETTGYILHQSVAVEDPDNQLFCFSYDMLPLKQQREMNPGKCPENISNKIDSLPEEANPMLVFYRIKE